MSRLDRMTDGHCDRLWTSLVETANALMDAIVYLEQDDIAPSHVYEDESLQAKWAEDLEHWNYVLDKARRLIGEENFSDTFGNH